MKCYKREKILLQNKEICLHTKSCFNIKLLGNICFSLNSWVILYDVRKWSVYIYNYWYNLYFSQKKLLSKITYRIYHRFFCTDLSNDLLLSNKMILNLDTLTLEENPCILCIEEKHIDKIHFCKVNYTDLITWWGTHGNP